MAEIEIITQRLKINLDKFFSLVSYMYQRTIAWQNYLKILDSKELLEKFNRKWGAFKVARSLGFVLVQDIGKFEEEKSHVTDFIRRNNPRLAQKIEKFKPVPDNTRPQLAALLTILSQNRATATAYIKTHSKELLAWADSSEDLNIKDVLRKLIIEISGDEVVELERCIADLRRWPTYRIRDYIKPDNVKFFHNRVTAYLGGGKLENESYIGLVRYFKDKSLIADIKESQALKMLLTYQKLIDFIATQRAVVFASVFRQGWEGFRGKDGFFYNLTKGENYIEMISETFGNKDIASKLRNMYESTGEYPRGWVVNLDSIIDRLKHPSYQNAYVIVPAAKDLIQIFERKRVGLLGESVDSKLDRLRHIVRKDYEVSIRKSRNLGIFEAILSAEMKSLSRETEEEKVRLRNLLVSPGEAIINFVEAAKDLIAMGEEDIHKKIAAFLKLRTLELQTLRRMRGIRGLSDEPRYAVNLYSFLLKYDRKLNEIDRWVNLVKVYGANALRYESEAIETNLKREDELRSSALVIDNHLVSVRNNYFFIRKQGKDISITDPEYLEVEESILNNI